MTQHQHIEPYAGYAVTNLKEAGGEESSRFEGIVTLHGRRVMHVSNGGEGGSHRYQPVGDDWSAFRHALAAFERYATEWNHAGEFAGIEDGDQLINRLAEVYVLNRKRAILFLLDDENFWETGTARAFRTGVTLEQSVQHLSRPRVHRKESACLVSAGGRLRARRRGHQRARLPGRPVTVSAEFTQEVVDRLNAAGLFALVDREVGPGAVCIELVHDELVGFIDIEDLSCAVTVDRAGTQRLIPNGPLPDHDACADAGCVSGAVLGWVLAQRAAAYAL